jgi:predicted TIM-barrel fold metal-dependent hydrolase
MTIKAIDACVYPYFREFSEKFCHLGYWKFLASQLPPDALDGTTVDFFIQAMDQAEVEMAGLVSFWALSSAGGSESSIKAEDLVPILKAHSKRLFGIVGLNPLLPVGNEYFAPRYLRRAVKELGFKAAHIGLHWFGISPNDKKLYPIYETCLELDIPLVLPLGAAPPRSGASTCAEPLLLDPVIGDFAELRIVGQSVGYPWERESVYLARNNANFSVLADSPQPQHWIPDFVGFIKQGRFPKYDAGSDQIMWGSNFPFVDPAESRRQFAAIDFNDTVSAQLLRENAVRIFKLAVGD